MCAALYVLLSAVAAFMLLSSNLMTDPTGSFYGHLRKFGRLLLFIGCVSGIAAVMQDGWQPRRTEVILMAGLVIVFGIQVRAEIGQVRKRREIGVQRDRRHEPV